MFENIIGNQRIKDTLEKAVKQNKTSHSYLFIGTQGIGKKIIATEFAKALLCLDEKRYCNECKSCIEFDSNNNPDFLCIKPDEEKNIIKVDQIRELQKVIQEKPIISNKKVYMINDAELMNTQAQNCLLKTLEEPPEFATIILIGSNETAFLPTIKSRCTILHFDKIQNNHIKSFLEKNFEIKNIDDDMIDVFQGSIGRAISLKDKLQEYKQLEQLVDRLDKADLIDILNNSELLYKSKDEINEILEYINVLLLKKAKQNYLYTNCINIVENTKKRLKQNANYDMCIDNMLFNMWEEVN